MAEQSSTVVAFRALVMLICLILIPVAAFCGGSFPAVVKAIQSGHWPTLADFRGPARLPSSNELEAPRFVPRPATCSAQATDPKTLNFPGPVPGCDPLMQGEARHSPVVAANYTAPIGTPPKIETGPSTGLLQDKDLGIGPTGRLSPLPPGTGSLLPLDHQTTTHADAQARSSGTAGSSPSGDQFNYVQDRLRQLAQLTTYLKLTAMRNANSASSAKCPSAEIPESPNSSGPLMAIP